MVNRHDGGPNGGYVDPESNINRDVGDNGYKINRNIDVERPVFFTKKSSNNKKNLGSVNIEGGILAGAYGCAPIDWNIESRNYGSQNVSGGQRTNPSRRLGQSANSSLQIDTKEESKQYQDNINQSRFRSPQMSRNNIENQLASMNRMKYQ